MIPIYKKGPVHRSGNYRGVYLTSIVSKVVERVFAEPLVPFLEAKGFGDAQWAFRKGSSAKDLVTLLVAKWTLLFCQGFKIGLYLSDISGAFDKVNHHIMMARCNLLQLAAQSSM